MKKIITFTCLYVAIMFSISCSKDKVSDQPTPIVPTTPTSPTNPNPPPASGTNIFANTEWTGIAAPYGQSYQKPCYLHFSGDTTVIIYALFNWVIGNNLEAVDSIVGKITSADYSNSAMVTINVNFPFTNDQQTYTITNKNVLKGGSIPTTMSSSYTVFTMQLELSPPSIENISTTAWGTDQIKDIGPTQGMYEFPDINGLSFNADGNTSYIRGGKIVTYTPPDQQQQILQHYIQIGPRIYFGGYNETIDRLIPYFGVLSADGNTILADTRSSGSRIPYYFQTIFWYGPPGVTPSMHKTN